MKTSLLVICLFFIFKSTLTAQRMGDIRIRYSTAKDNAVAIPDQVFNFSFVIYNNDTTKITSGDSFNLYSIENGDTAKFFLDGKLTDHFPITGMTIPPGDSFLHNYAMVFDKAHLNTDQNICTILLPSGSTNPIKDENLTNNTICVKVLVRKSLDLNNINGNDVSINIFPNPCKDHFSVTSSVPVQSIRIYDLCGREVQVIQPDDLSMIPLSLPSPGAYIVKFITATAVLARTIMAE